MNFRRIQGRPVSPPPRQLPGRTAQRPQQAQPAQPRHVSGPIDRVPCPHCGHPNDLRDFHGQQLLDTGNIIDCLRCQRLFFVAQIKPVLHVAVRVPTPTDVGQRVARPQRAAAPARTIGPAETRRLIGRR